MRSSSLVLTACLLLASCGNNGPYSPSGPTGTVQSAAEERGYTSGKFMLDLAGHNCGLLQRFWGGEAEAPVVLEKTFGGKHLGTVRYNDIIVQIPLRQSACLEWARDTLAGKATRKSGRVTRYDAQFAEASVHDFTNAAITEIGFPALDAGSKEPAFVTLRFRPELVRQKAGSGVKVAPPKEDLASPEFALAISGMKAPAVAKIAAFAVKWVPVAPPPGELPDYEKEPASMEIPNLVVTIAESHADEFYTWHEDFVIKGNCGEKYERTGTIQYLSPDGASVLLSLELEHLGIYKASRAEPTNDDKMAMVTAGMYVERINLKFGGLPMPSGGAAGK